MNDAEQAFQDLFARFGQDLELPMEAYYSVQEQTSDEVWAFQGGKSAENASA